MKHEKETTSFSSNKFEFDDKESLMLKQLLLETTKGNVPVEIIGFRNALISKLDPA